VKPRTAEESGFQNPEIRKSEDGLRIKKSEKKLESRIRKRASPENAQLTG
jgi:hypothetical protein